MSSPLLLNGYKFDLRIYVLLSGPPDGIRVYVCREGLVRVCSETYQKPAANNIYKTSIHLTNYSLNKRTATFSHAVDGCKRPLSSLWEQFRGDGVPVDEIWDGIKHLIGATILAVPEMYQSGCTNCFQLFWDLTL